MPLPTLNLFSLLDFGAPASKRVRESDRAYDSLKSMIITVELPPGTIINEKLLADHVKIGRTPVREAIQRLTAEGLVQIIPRRGIFVSNIGVRDMHEILEMRLELERIAVTHAARRGTEADFVAMGEILSKAPVARGTQYYPLLDLAFHRAIGAAAKNSQMESLIANYHQLTLRLLYLNQTRDEAIDGLHAQHRDILDALRARDTARAQAMIARHIDGVRAVLFGAPGR